jgi:hypothetical protein
MNNPLIRYWLGAFPFDGGFRSSTIHIRRGTLGARPAGLCPSQPPGYFYHQQEVANASEG